ncbi:alpha/beta hydrolase [uncultured Cohaesibacter sp.]|uniref:alpha/beta hydrolase n=1 Tax=uncultured Cohaesibacter sp. TaxID=1002546 RepID=UPI0029C626C4|nr:alpha/beta hydrolase [uncultured Cohaesibacter sp.]
MPMSPPVSFYYHTNKRSVSGHPLVFLHGSGRTESDSADFLAQLSLHTEAVFIRGQHSQTPGYTFVRRNDDLSLDYDEIAGDAKDLAGFLVHLTLQNPNWQKPPVLIGYSSGAIMAAAILWHYRDLIAGAVLLRPQSPSMERPAPLKGLPVLMLSGLWDERRDADASLHLEIQLEQARAKVTHVTLRTGHGEAEDGSDFSVTKRWLEETFSIR